jgi:hypothetical protein
MSEVANVHQASQKGGAEDSPYLKLPDGDCSTVLRLLPAAKGEKRPYYLFQAHKVGGKMVVCRRVPDPSPSRILWKAPPEGGDCPVCLYHRGTWNKYNPGKPPEDVEVVLKEIKPMTRCSWNVIARQVGDKKNVGPLVWTCGITVAQTIWGRILGDPKLGRKGLGDIFSPDAGRDLILYKKMEGGFPKYQIDFNDPGPAGTPEEWERWVKGLHDLVAQPATYEELRHRLAVHQGLEEDEDQSGFDLKQFDRRPEGAQPAKEEKPLATHTKKPPEEPLEGEEEVLADPEFVAELEAMKDDLK